MEESIFSYIMPRKGVCARARLEFPEIVVLKGSVVAQNEAPSLPQRYQRLRDHLIRAGVIAWRDGYLVFTLDHRFANASEAVCVVEAGSRNGYCSWRNSDGQTLLDLGHRRPI